MQSCRETDRVPNGDARDQGWRLSSLLASCKYLGVSDNSEVTLEGGSRTTVSRKGDVIFRSAKPQSRTVISLLQHLRSVGFGAAPRPMGSGFAPDGREQFEFIDGESPQPLAWSDAAAWEIGHLLRQFHDAGRSFSPPANATWSEWFARSLPGSSPVFGHGDLGPWNILAKDGVPVAFIDWDNAGPVDAVWELAHVAWQNGQLHDDDVAQLNDLPDASHRAHQVRLIVDGYGLRAVDRSDFVDKMIELAIRSAREEAIDYSVGPDTDSAFSDGYPVMWAITGRARGAAWMIDHRTMLNAALTT